MKMIEYLVENGAELAFVARVRIGMVNQSKTYSVFGNVPSKINQLGS